MRCMNCGASLKRANICPRCGCDVSVQRKAQQLSVMYYNQGLDKAQIRDLSGAIDLLRRSLKYNKTNIDARNLLGLVYFETGEAVAAVSEWIISKNLKPEQNIASDYIQKLQAEPTKLDMINQTIRKYNIALGCCREGNDDIAAVQLKKILSQNPKFIKAYHLLALIQMKNGEYESARKILKKASRIDKTNSTTLRFLKEIDEQTGKVTKLDDSSHIFWKKESGEKETVPSEIYMADGETVIQPTAFRETSVFANIVNILIGIGIGALALWFLVVPAVRQSANRSADERVVEYSNTMAAQNAKLNKLQTQIEESEQTVQSAQEQIQAAETKTSNYENLVKAYASYQDGNYEQALNLLQNISDSSALSADAKSMYDSMIDEVSDQMFDRYSDAGVAAFDSGDYATAVENLEKAKTINGNDYTVLSYLAHAYRKQADIENALSVFREIAEKYPNTRRATTAQHYIDLLEQGDTGDGSLSYEEEEE